MEENLNYQKQTKAFIAIAVIANTLFYSVLSILTRDIDYKNPTLNSELMLRLPSIAVTIILLTLLFFMGKKLTDDKKKALIFMGSVYFGDRVVSAVTAFFSCGLDALTTLRYITPNVFGILTAVIEIIEIPFVIVAAYYAFTAFEGLNPKFGGENLDQSQMPLGRARTRYFVYELIGSTVIGTLSTLPTFLLGFFAMNSLYTSNSETFTVILTQIASAFSPAVLLFIYIAGYKPYKSRIDGMAFIACSGLSGEVSRILTNLLLIPQMLSLNSLTSGAYEIEAELGSVLIRAGSTGILSILTVVISIGISLFMLKYFFPPMKVTLFTEQTDTPEVLPASVEDTIIREEEPADETVEGSEAQSETE